MTYASEKVILDADSHVMEVPGWLDDFVTKDMRGRLNETFMKMFASIVDQASERATLRSSDPETAADAADRVMLDKSWFGLGAFDSRERSRALDALGFEAQLVFPTFGLGFFNGSDDDLMRAGASALNRKMADFCGEDDRLLAVGYVPLRLHADAARLAEEAIDVGCKAIWINHLPAGDKSPTHPDLGGFWDVLEGANVPFVLHVGGAGQPGTLINKAYNNNGVPVPDHFGPVGEGMGPKDSVAVDHAAQIFLGALIFDGLFDRYPNVRGGVIEQGAGWVVTWIRRMDQSLKTFEKFDERLAGLSCLPSEYVRQRLKFTPYSGEPVGWMIENAFPELFMFSTDYPHPEGGTKPIHHFDESLHGIDPDAIQRFYSGNMRELLTGSPVPAAAA